MSIDPLSGRSGRIEDFSGAGQQPPENPQPAADSSKTSAPSNPQNQNPEAANVRRSEAAITANQLQSQLLSQTNKSISTGINRIPNPSPNTGGGAVQRALKMYGITNDQLQHYITTGEEPEGLKKAIHDAATKGDWPALHVVRSSFQKRAEYLRANSSPADKDIRQHADQLDAAAESLIQNRAAMQMKKAGDLMESSKKSTPDKAHRKIGHAYETSEQLAAETEAKIKPRK